MDLGSDIENSKFSFWLKVREPMDEIDFHGHHRDVEGGKGA
jgi:hypothetical protein